MVAGDEWRAVRSERRRARAGRRARSLPAGRPQMTGPSGRPRRAASALALLLALLLGSLASCADGSAGTSVRKSASGYFYDAPGPAPKRPGVLLRSEAMTAGVPPGGQAWKILYTTTRADGAPALATPSCSFPPRARHRAASADRLGAPDDGGGAPDALRRCWAGTSPSTPGSPRWKGCCGKAGRWSPRTTPAWARPARRPSWSVPARPARCSTRCARPGSCPRSGSPARRSCGVTPKAAMRRCGPASSLPPTRPM